VSNNDQLTGRVIGLAIEVHSNLGPGLLESAYEDCLCLELTQADIPFRRQVGIPTIYKGHSIADTYRADILVADALILEIKAVDKLTPIHEAQILT
jgi:GxxExxY protein